jgi:hypothetical protein
MLPHFQLGPTWQPRHPPPDWRCNRWSAGRLGFGGRLACEVKALGACLDIAQAGNLMPPFLASSIRRGCSDAFSASVTVSRFSQPGNDQSLSPVREFIYLSTITCNNAMRSVRYCEVLEVR